jgi:hypothetical protein
LLMGKETPSPITPVSVAVDVLSGLDVNKSIALLLASVLLGYATKPLTTTLSDSLTGWVLKKWNSRNTAKNSNKGSDGGDIAEDPLNRAITRNQRDFRLPFHKDHADETYFDLIANHVNKIVFGEPKGSAEAPAGIQTPKPNATEILDKLPKARTQPFSICKRILREVSPHLWEEAERREAEVRMLGSFLMAALFNFACAVILLTSRGFYVPFEVGIWVAVSLMLVCYLSVSYIKQKKAEVEYVYMNYLVATSQYLRNMKTESKL